MKTIGVQFVLLAVLLLFGMGGAYALTVNYGDLSLNPGYQATSFADKWDLTKGDLTLTYSVDLSAVGQPAAYATSYTEVGIRQTGSDNFNPGPYNIYQGGEGGWMTSLVGNLTPSPGTLSLMDKHNLAASGERSEGDYDATAPGTIGSKIGAKVTYGIWFDRDTVDSYQATYWGSSDGKTYNTRGKYDIVITYHAVDATMGTMFATVNGIKTGFYSSGWKNAEPETYPRGLSFKGDMTDMQVFAGLWAPSGVTGAVAVEHIVVVGQPAGSVSVPEFSSMAVALGIVLSSSVLVYAGYYRKR
jgi:hypothetical protein